MHINKKRSIEEIRTELKAIESVLANTFKVELPTMSFTGIVSDVLEDKITDYVKQRVCDWEPAALAELVLILTERVEKDIENAGPPKTAPMAQRQRRNKKSLVAN